MCGFQLYYDFVSGNKSDASMFSSDGNCDASSNSTLYKTFLCCTGCFFP